MGLNNLHPILKTDAYFLHNHIIKTASSLQGRPTYKQWSLELPMKYGGHIFNLTKDTQKKKKNALMKTRGSHRDLNFAT